MEIEFAEGGVPPRVHRGPQEKWSEFLLPLKGRPGVWAKLKTYRTRAAASAAAYELRKGWRKTPPGKWDFTYRVGDGETALYGVFIGEEK